MEGQLFTWESLTAMGGASLLTFLTVQTTKKLMDRLVKFPTDLYAVLVAFFWLLVSNIAIGADPKDWRVYLLNLANGFLVGLSSGKIHDLVIHPPGGQKKGGGEK